VTAAPGPGERDPTAIRALPYVALGDSYTIGTALADDRERWPNQLVAALATGSPMLELAANLGVNGYTSADVIEHELPALDAIRPEFASILVGVNDVVQGVPLATYRANAGRILDQLRARLAADRIVAVGTPDYTVTPQGAAYGDPVVQAAAIRAANATLGELAAAHGIAFVDIHDLSLRAAADGSLVADDGLHPSGAQYALWVERIAPVVARLIRGRASDGVRGG
jgi:lysophospholipase L1-like esterase